jgi:hypothetical protein
MQSFLAAQNVSLSFDLTLTGMTVTGVEVTVLDHEGVTVVARAPLAGYTPGAESAEVTILAVNNALAADLNAAARTVNVYVTGTGAAAAIALLSASYRLVREDRLPVPDASFQTLAGADMEAEDMVNLAGWAAATESNKVSALMEARHRIAGMKFHYIPENWQSRVTREIDLPNLEDLSAAEFAVLDVPFRTALRRAQVVEANYILERASSQDAAYRDAGVVSIVIGESSRTYARNRSVESSRPLHTRTLAILSRYLAPARIARG